MAEVSVTIKAGAGFDSPWIVVRGESAEDASQEIEKLRELGAFSAVKMIAREFQRAPAAGEETVEAVLGPVSEAEDAAPAATGPAPGAGGSAAAAPPEQLTPPCSQCGAQTKSRSGTGRNGPYKGYACTADRKHFDLIKD